MVNEYSCVCLHGDRRPQERKNNLKAFKVYCVFLALFLSLSLSSISFLPPPSMNLLYLLLIDVSFSHCRLERLDSSYVQMLLLEVLTLLVYLLVRYILLTPSLPFY